MRKMENLIHKAIKKISVVSMLIYFFLIACEAAVKRKKQSDRILLVEGGHMGDAIVDASAFESLISRFKAQNKEICILCSKQTWNSLQLFSFAQQIRCIGYSPDRDWQLQNAVCLHKEVKKHSFDTVIGLTSVPCLLWYAAGCTFARQKFFLVEPERMNGFFGFYFQLLCRMQNTSVVLGDKEANRAQWLESYMSKLGEKEFKYKIVPIGKLCDISALPRKYFSVVVDSADMWKRWPLERFIALTNALLKGTEYDVCFLGTDKSEYVRYAIENGLADAHERVHNLIGKTSIPEWVERIRNSEFLIGVDSGAIHVAACVGTVSFCINGWWHGNRFLPYREDSASEGTALPVCISSSSKAVLSCRNCASYRTVGYGNTMCCEQVKAGGPCLCLDKTTLANVMKAVNMEKNRRPCNDL